MSTNDTLRETFVTFIHINCKKKKKREIIGLFSSVILQKSLTAKFQLQIKIINYLMNKILFN